MTVFRSRAVLPLAVVAVLASACTGTTPTAEHPTARSNTPAGTATSGPTRTRPTGDAEPSGPPSESGKPDAVQPCPTSSLDVSLRPTGAAAGSTYQQLVFTNTGDARCTLTGFPGVSMVQRPHGDPLGASADRTGATNTVALSPGGSARARLQITDAQNYSEDRCGQTPAKGLRVYPPNQTQSVFVPDDLLACAHTSVQVLYVQSVRAQS